MKLVLVCSALCVVIMSSFVAATDPMDCEKCDPDLCAPTGDCKCESYLDECGCCEICYRCPGEECSHIARDKCYGGVCKSKEGADPIDAINKPGVCQ
uniref:U14-Austrotoxin-Ht1a_1 n=1 Tax=Hickmania troglodytes TaxID=489260 RepID=A0A482ZFR7_9ARAC